MGGIPVASNIHLFQRQHDVNRSENLERMVHPCEFAVILDSLQHSFSDNYLYLLQGGSGAFGYFATTKEISQYYKVRFEQILLLRSHANYPRPIS